MTQTSPDKPTGGVLQIPAAATQKNPPKPAKKPPKPAAPRLKLLVRRLPPGLTQAEFKNALGEEWKAGGGKVDWFQYKAGKVSKDAAKPSRPSRAYVHVVSADHIAPLSDKVRQTSFLDARHTANDAVLLGPPSLEFAPYAKVPGGRARKDARQGTIDQDPEFISFLESLTQPVTKPAIVEPTTDGEEKKDGKPTTPLVQYIREKKANKAKESAAAKATKQAKADKDTKADKAQAKKLLQRADKDAAQQPTEKGEKKAKADKASKEAVKAANKQAANAAKQAAKGPAAKDTPSAPAADRKKERGNAAAAAKILQRDLGLGAGGRRKAGKASSGTESPKEEQAAEAEQKEPSPKPGRGRGKGSSTTSQNTEALSRAVSDEETPPVSNPAQRKPSKPAKAKAPSVTPTATQAFLKHANPSQGVTEALLETAFAPFGKVVKVEIDRKKGFGYVDFAEPDGLQKAIAGSPVTVAESQVVVLERKMNVADKGRRGKPGEGRGRGRQRKEGITEKTEK
ncbi:hypothetical protein PHISP_01041 [Aspergillus sp. HF37]|nr:hypothetical protein PHISP_01041 [Aspergillus sp. HF37]